VVGFPPSLLGIATGPWGPLGLCSRGRMGPLSHRLVGEAASGGRECAKTTLVAQLAQASALPDHSTTIRTAVAYRHQAPHRSHLRHSPWSHTTAGHHATQAPSGYLRPADLAPRYELRLACFVALHRRLRSTASHVRTVGALEHRAAASPSDQGRWLANPLHRGRLDESLTFRTWRPSSSRRHRLQTTSLRCCRWRWPRRRCSPAVLRVMTTWHSTYAIANAALPVRRRPSRPRS
jgi:hypothetical protein